MAHQIPNLRVRLNLTANTFNSNYAYQTDLHESDESDDGYSTSSSFLNFVRDLPSFDARPGMEIPNYDGDSWDSASEDIDGIPRVYNTGNVVTSDVVVRFDGGRKEFLSEKRILSAKSAYFQRAFSGKFPVADADVIDLGDDDCASHIYDMLCFIHGITYRKIHQRSSMGRNLDYHIDLYMMGEQFDIRTLRHAAATTFLREAIFLADTPWFPLAVQRILGPDALVMADQHLVEITIKICIEQISILVKNERFVEMAHAGELADEAMMARLYLALGEHISEISGEEVWQSDQERLDDAHIAMLRAENAMGPGPWDRSTIAGQIMTARATSAAWTALTNLALLVPQPTWAPPPAILAHQPPTAAALAANAPPPVSHPAVARVKPSFINSIRTKASSLNKTLSSPFKKTPSV